MSLRAGVLGIGYLVRPTICTEDSRLAVSCFIAFAVLARLAWMMSLMSWLTYSVVRGDISARLAMFCFVEYLYGLRFSS